MKRLSAIVRRASIAAKRLRAEISPKPSHSLRAAGLAVARLQREDVGGGLDQALLEEQLDLLVAEPLDVEGVARAEVLQALDRLRRTDQPPVQRRTTSASPVFSSISRNAAEPQTGQTCGNS